MVLSEIAPGAYCLVTHIKAGRNPQRRLAGLGIVPGTIVQVMAHHPAGGPTLLKLGNSHMAIGRSLASAIKVTPAAKIVD